MCKMIADRLSEEPSLAELDDLLESDTEYTELTEGTESDFVLRKDEEIQPLRVRAEHPEKDESVELEKPVLTQPIAAEHAERRNRAANYDGHVDTDRGGNWRKVRAELRDRSYVLRERDSGEVDLEYFMDLGGRDIERPRHYVSKRPWKDEMVTMMQRVETCYRAAVEAVEHELPGAARSEDRPGDTELEALAAEMEALGGDIDTIAENYYSGEIESSNILSPLTDRVGKRPDRDPEFAFDDDPEERDGRNQEYMKLYLKTVGELAEGLYTPENVRRAADEDMYWRG